MVTPQVAKYITDLNTLEPKYRAMFHKINEGIRIAFIKASCGDKSLTRIPGGYVVVQNNELINITQYQNGDLEGYNGWWIASEAHNRWYSDPTPTLKRMRYALGIEK